MILILHAIKLEVALELPGVQQHLVENAGTVLGDKTVNISAQQAKENPITTKKIIDLYAASTTAATTEEKKRVVQALKAADPEKPQDTDTKLLVAEVGAPHTHDEWRKLLISFDPKTLVDEVLKDGIQRDSAFPIQLALERLANIPIEFNKALTNDKWIPVTHQKDVTEVVLKTHQDIATLPVKYQTAVKDDKRYWQDLIEKATLAELINLIKDATKPAIFPTAECMKAIHKFLENKTLLLETLKDVTWVPADEQKAFDMFVMDQLVKLLQHEIAQLPKDYQDKAHQEPRFWENNIARANVPAMKSLLEKSNKYPALPVDKGVDRLYALLKATSNTDFPGMVEGDQSWIPTAQKDAFDKFIVERLITIAATDPKVLEKATAYKDAVKKEEGYWKAILPNLSLTELQGALADRVFVVTMKVTYEARITKIMDNQPKETSKFSTRYEQGPILGEIAALLDKNPQGEIKFSQDDIVEIMQDLDKKDPYQKFAVLNFANKSGIGGAQEGEIARATTLADQMTKDNLFNAGTTTYKKTIPVNGCIYTKGVKLSTSGRNEFDIISSATSSRVNANTPYTSAEEAQVKKLIKMVLDVAKENKVKTIVLGPWGCGVFRHPAVGAAKAFEEVINEGNYAHFFEKIIFSAPPIGTNCQDNIDAFKAMVVRVNARMIKRKPKFDEIKKLSLDGLKAANKTDVDLVDLYVERLRNLVSDADTLLPAINIKLLWIPDYKKSAFYALVIQQLIFSVPYSRLNEVPEPYKSDDILLATYVEGADFKVLEEIRTNNPGKLVDKIKNRFYQLAYISSNENLLKALTQNIDWVGDTKAFIVEQLAIREIEDKDIPATYQADVTEKRKDPLFTPKIAVAPGLVNCDGNACYMNAMLQNLFRIKAFRNGIRAAALGAKSRNVEAPVTKALANVFNEMRKDNASTVSGDLLKTFKNKLADQYDKCHYPEANIFRNSSQEDSNELLQKLFKYLVMELDNGIEESSTFTINLFGSHSTTSYKCTTCTNSTTRKDFNLSLELPIVPGKDLEGCLAEIKLAETLSGKNQRDCPYCKTKKEATITLSFSKPLPNTLILTLKRFDKNKEKISTIVDFKGALNFEKQNYLLKGVVYHIGSVAGGHYVASCQEDDGKWYDYNDSIRSNGSAVSDAYPVRNGNAYIFFYEKAP